MNDDSILPHGESDAFSCGVRTVIFVNSEPLSGSPNMKK